MILGATEKKKRMGGRGVVLSRGIFNDWGTSGHPIIVSVVFDGTK